MNRKYEIPVEDLIVSARDAKITNTMFLEKPEYWEIHRGNGKFEVKGCPTPDIGVPTQSYIAMDEASKNARQLEAGARRYYMNLVTLDDEGLTIRYENALDDYARKKNEYDQGQRLDQHRANEYLLKLKDKYRDQESEAYSSGGALGEVPRFTYDSSVPLNENRCKAVLHYCAENHIDIHNEIGMDKIAMWGGLNKCGFKDHRGHELFPPRAESTIKDFFKSETPLKFKAGRR